MMQKGIATNTIKGDVVIYQKQEGLYNMKLNGTDPKTLVSGGVSNFNITVDWVIGLVNNTNWVQFYYSNRRLAI